MKRSAIVKYTSVWFTGELQAGDMNMRVPKWRWNLKPWPGGDQETVSIAEKGMEG